MSKRNQQSHRIRFIAALLLAVVFPSSYAHEDDTKKLRCTFGAPTRAPTESAAVELARFWSDEPLSRPLYLVYNSVTKIVTLDPELDSLAKLTSTGPPRPGSIVSGESIAFTIDMLWLEDLKSRFSTARFNISIDTYSLESEIVIELVKPGQTAELYKTAWIRRGKCIVRAL